MWRGGENVGPSERRQRLLEVLCLRRQDTYENLVREFNVSKMTIRRDVMVLTCSYPVETVSGRYGGVRVAKWYRPNYRPSRIEPLTIKQAALLKKLREQLSGEELETMDSILFKFSP